MPELGGFGPPALFTPMSDNDRLLNSAYQIIRGAWCPQSAEGGIGAQFVQPETTPGLPLAINAANQAVAGSTTTTLRAPITQTGPRPDQSAPMWWNIEIVARGLQTIAAGVAGTPEATIPWDTLAVGGFPSPLGAKIAIQTDGDEIVVDAISNRYSVFTRVVNLSLLVPLPAVQQNQGSQQGLNNGVRGVAANTLLGNVAVTGTIRSGVAPLGERLGQLTQTVLCVNGGVNLIPIPNRAVRVQFWQDTAGPSPAPVMSWQTGTPPVATSFDRGRIDFTAGMFRTEILSIPGSAQFVDLGVDVRRITAVWHLEF